jgi:beta/gamma crystallin
LTFTGRRFWWRGGWRTLIGVGLLTGFAIGPDFYYPEGYVALAEPACTGYTDDGCTMRWQDVAADDGSTIPQCVQFCPRVRKAVSPGAAAAPVAAAPRSGCEVEVFKDPNLAGGSFRTSEDQPILNDEWDKKIASINVISGTWDFTTEQQYNGDAMRLTPGTYRDLGPNWVDQISSFMCAQ